MSDVTPISTPMSIAGRVDLLFEEIRHPGGHRITYDDIRRVSGVDPSTISRVRSGQIHDPSFSSINGIATAFGVSLDYFGMAVDETALRAYLRNRQDEQAMERLRLAEQELTRGRVESLAHRAAFLDDEGLEAIAGMVNYVLTQKGITDKNLMDGPASE